MQNSVLEFNRASGQGGAFNAVSGDGTFFANVTFHQNSGTVLVKGGVIGDHDIGYDFQMHL